MEQYHSSSRLDAHVCQPLPGSLLSGELLLRLLCISFTSQSKAFIELDIPVPCKAPSNFTFISSRSSLARGGFFLPGFSLVILDAKFQPEKKTFTAVLYKLMKNSV